jgi:hypothetical protein
VQAFARAAIFWKVRHRARMALVRRWPAAEAGVLALLAG